MTNSLVDKSKARGKGVIIEPSLCLYTPRQVYNAILNDDRIKKWLDFIANRYVPPKKYTLLLIYPCSADKPYHKSRSYKALYKTLNSIPARENKIHLATISEPYALIPEEFYSVKDYWYDCPGLFEWFCRRYNLEYEKELADRCIEILAECIWKFLKRNKDRYTADIIAFIRTYTSSLTQKHDHTHRRMVELVNNELSDNGTSRIKILPPKDLVSQIVSKNRFAWDMYGVAHPVAQRYLYSVLTNYFSNNG